VDLNVDPLKDADIAWADYVLLSAMLVHDASAREVAGRCRRLRRPVIAGGPLFTTKPECIPEIEHVVMGEAEEIMPQLVEDMAAGQVRPRYESNRRPDVAHTPIPRWDLVDMRHYATMPVQFSRGCPFDCEFCDIVVMNGRIPRSKTPARMIEELEALAAAGWDGPIFVVDDNFIGNRARVKALLRELIAWRRRRSFRTTFTTEASLNVVDDPELLSLMVQAGFKRLFVGIESPDDESLAECAKVQNHGRDMVSAVRTIQNAGMEVMGGFIVGFDSDTPSIFERQKRFIQEAGVVTAMVGLLTALPGTRLFKRLMQEGRIVQHSTGNNVDAVLNFVPRLERRSLIEGYRSLVKHLYMPSLYYSRILTFLRAYRPSGPKTRIYGREVRAFLASLWVLGVRTRGRIAYWRFFARVVLFHRRAFGEAMGLAIAGHHFRLVAAEL
jgi:radical SAM superfamily enzyme YgiQ (UPF0313 family)